MLLLNAAICVRQATLDDEPRLSSLVAALGDELEERFGYPSSNDMVQAVVRHGVENDDAVFVAEFGGELVGVVAWVNPPGFAADIAHGLGTYVVPNWRRKGVSEQLRKAAMAHCRSKGRRWVYGTASTGNEAGIVSGVGVGFREIGRLYRLEL